MRERQIFTALCVCDSWSDLARASKGKAAREASSMEIVASSKRFSERNSESANFHWFVRFCRSRNFLKKEKFRERRSGCRVEIRPSRLNFPLALVLKFLERKMFHSFVGPLSEKVLMKTEYADRVNKQFSTLHNTMQFQSGF